jgi:hypothetical protein|tara:strand:+ start:3870 stop:4361 length:492 start_codon:yes stop_codon:yes gene_type:complete
MSMNETDIASFAESMLTETIQSGKPVQFAAAQSADAPDVSEVEIPDNFTLKVLQEGHWDKANVDVELKDLAPAPVLKEQTKVQESPEKPAVTISEDSRYKKYLLKEYKKKIEDLKGHVSLMEEVGLLNESMGTTAGMVSTTAVTPKRNLRKKKKTPNGSRSSY